MDENKEKDISVIAVTLAVGAFALLAFFVFGGLNKSKNEKNDSEENQKEEKNTKEGSKSKAKKSVKYVKPSKKIVSNFTHPLLHTTLKGHVGLVTGLDLSVNGKYLATCGDDRTVRLWSVKEFGKGNKFIHVNIDLDHAKKVRFSPDSRAFIVGLAVGNSVRIYKLSKKEDGSATATPFQDDFKEICRSNLLNIGIGTTASGGSFIMAAYSDTTIVVFDLQGNVLHTINTHQSNNHCASVSPCGRFIACSGWTPDVKVWEVSFTRTGEYKEVFRAFELKGHTSSVWSFAFNNDSTSMISVSKDGTWRFYNTNIEYGKGQEPYLIRSGQFTVCGQAPSEIFCKVALSPDATVAAVAASNNITVFSTRTGEVEFEMKEVHLEEIREISFDIAGRYILSCGDRFVRVFYNTLGVKERIHDLTEKLKVSSSNMRDRLQVQLDEAKKNLKEMEEKTQK